MTMWNMNNADRPVNGHKVGATSLVPSNITKGSSGATLSAMIYGDFSQLYIGQWGGLELIVDPYTLAASGQIRLVLNAFMDVAIPQPLNFALIKDIVA
jgi:hypothetical protein